MSLLFATLAVLLVAIGILGAFLPGLPGAALVLAGLFWLAWLDGFQNLGFGLLAVLVVLTLLFHSIDPLATAFGAKELGASRRAVGASRARACIKVAVYAWASAVPSVDSTART